MPTEETAKKLCLNLLSGDKKVRKEALIDLQKHLSKSSDLTYEHEVFVDTHMYTLNTFRDKAEAVREQGIKFMSFLLVDKLPINDFYLTYLFPVLVERVGTVELIEESEEIRLEILKLLNAIIVKYSKTEQLRPFLNDCVLILVETVKDKYYQVKESSCICIRELAEALPRDFHMQAESLLKPTITCFSHQRFKIRVEGIRAVGVIVTHASYNALNEAVGPLAEKLFDQIPAVRRAVGQVAFNLLTNYRDRYSFFHKILPLLLTGLNDEIEETRLEACELWDKVGLQYQKENEKDLKNQIDFLMGTPENYPESFLRPNLGCRVLIQRNIGKLTNALSYELTGWQEDVRVRCSQLLCSIALNAEDGLTQHLQELLPAMYSAATDDDQRVQDNIMRASEILGIFVPPQAWTQLVLPAVENGPHHGHIIVLTHLIKGAPDVKISAFLETIIKILSDESICFTRKCKLQTSLIQCVRSILEKQTEKGETELGYHCFKIVVSLVSLRDVVNNFDIGILDEIYESLSMENVKVLWGAYLGRLLAEIDTDPRSWTLPTPQRCIFATILTESGEAFGENLPKIGALLVDALDFNSDPESRLDTFNALSEAFEEKEIIFKNALDLDVFFTTLIEGVFIPSLVWHAGLTAEALRTMAASCLLVALSRNENIELYRDGDKLREVFNKLLPLLLSLIEDASSQSRVIGLECINTLKGYLVDKNQWLTDDLITIYPEILKRLDDPTEKVRKCALTLLPSFFEKCPLEFGESHYRAHCELIVDTLMTHFDDEEEVVRNLVYDVFKSIALINPSELNTKIHRHQPLLRNQKGCTEIIEYLKNLKL